MNRKYAAYDQHGYTLIELLIVLAVIGAMVGTLVFFALPSSLQAEKAKAKQTFELMQQVRLRAIMQRQIFGLDKPEGENFLQVLILDSGVSAPISLSPPITDEEAFAGIGFNDAEDQNAKEGDKKDEEEEDPVPTALERDALAASLGLAWQTSSPHWKLAASYEKIDFGKDGIFFFMRQSAPDLDYLDEEFYSFLDEETDEDIDARLQPELIFFPNGRLSAPGSVRLSTNEEDIIYAFSWDVSGDFQIERR